MEILFHVDANNYNLTFFELLHSSPWPNLSNPLCKSISNDGDPVLNCPCLSLLTSAL